MEQIKPDTPLVYLTVEQFTSLLHKLLPTQEPVKESLPEYFGIDAFCEVTGYKKNTVYQLVENELPQQSQIIEVKRKAENIDLDVLRNKGTQFLHATGELKDYKTTYSGLSMEDM